MTDLRNIRMKKHSNGFSGFAELRRHIMNWAFRVSEAGKRQWTSKNISDTWQRLNICRGRRVKLKSAAHRRQARKSSQVLQSLPLREYLFALAISGIWGCVAAAQQGIVVPGSPQLETTQPSVLAEEPKPELERPTVWGEPTEVQIGIYVIDVDEVNSADQSFAASVYFEARWRNPFLRHEGPGPKQRSLSDVWNPRLTIVGQQMIWRSYPDSVEIRPDGTVVYRQKLWGRFSQPLQLRDFPFDRQQLSIHMVAAGLLEDDVKIVPLVNESGTTSGVAKAFSLPDFDVVDFEVLSQPYFPRQGHPGVAGFELRIQIVRQPTYFILKVIIPLCLIVIMSWLPRWINPKETGTNIGISTSAFLTLVAYLFAITVLLPRVSYVTRMDRFILLSTLMVFAGLIQSAWNTVMVGKQKNKTAEWVGNGSRFLYPFLLLVVLVYSFLL